LNARLVLARAEAQELNDTLQNLDRRLAARETASSATRTRLAEIAQTLAALPDEDVNIDPAAAPSLAEAGRWRTHAESLALIAENRAREAQLLSQPVRFAAMAMERGELAATSERLSALISELEDRATLDDAAVVTVVELEIDETDPGFPLARSLADRDTELRQDRNDVSGRLNDVRSLIADISQRRRALEDRYATARRIVEFAGDSNVLGRVLLTYWEEIENFEIADPTSRLSREAGSAVIRRIELEERLAQLLSASAFVSSELRGTAIDPESVPAGTRRTLFDLARTLRQQLRDLIIVESEYIDALGELEAAYTGLSSEISAYRTYIESLIVWIPNHSPLWSFNPAGISAEFANALTVASTLLVSVDAGLVMAILLGTILLRYRKRLEAWQTSLNARIGPPRDDSIRYTLHALGIAGLRALGLPMFIFGAAQLFEPQHSDANADFFLSLNNAALLLFVMMLMRIVMEPGGIGRMHFVWRSANMDLWFGELGFLIRWWFPLTVAAMLATGLTPNFGDEFLSRALTVLALLVVMTHLLRNQLPAISSSGRSWLTEPVNRLRLVLLVIFALMLSGVVYGQVFAVSLIFSSLANSIWIGVPLLLVHAVLLRWLRVARRHLRISELLALREQSSVDEDSSISVVEDEANLADISTETQQLVNMATVVGGLIAVYWIWAPLLPALDAFARVTLWTSTTMVEGEAVTSQITLATVLTVSVLAALTLFAAKRLPAVVEIVLRSRTSVSPGARYTTSTMLNYLIIGIGIIAGLSALGLQWGQLQWLVAALGVGIGFGLQEIVANFISGLIILFERPIRVGDIITIGDKDGTVLKIRIRATTIRDWDGKELLVPNKEFITGRLLNWTLTDSSTRLVIPVGIAYGSDVDKAIELLEQVLDRHPKVLEDPSSSVLFLGFGDNSLNLVARCYVGSVDDRMPVISGLHRQINTAFKDAGIVIAFPQRDLHLDSEKPLRIALQSNSEHQEKSS
jgi:potassium efflux system protein